MSNTLNAYPLYVENVRYFISYKKISWWHVNVRDLL